MENTTQTTSLFNDPLLADVTVKQISSDGSVREYPAHKAILSNLSTFFRNAFRGDFREATENVIEVHDDDPEYFELFMKYLYTRDMAPCEVTVADQIEHEVKRLAPLAHDVQVYTVADKYGCTELMDMAAKSAFQFCPVIPAVGRDKVGELIELHYSNCAAAKCRMGQAVGWFLISYITLRDVVEEKVMKYPELSRDIYLVCKARKFTIKW